MTAILRITDGTTRVDLLHGAWRVEGWKPEIAAPKSGGSYSSSPLSDGKRLKSFRWDNVTERMTLSLNTSNQDAAAQQLQTIRRLLIQAHEYWTESKAVTPVYIEVRAAHETNTRYALIMQGMVGEESNPFGQEFAPFFGLTQHATMTELPLVFERLHWTTNPPGDSTCLKLSSQSDWQFLNWEDREAGTTTSLCAIELASGTLLVGADDGVWRSATGASGTWVHSSFALGDWDFDPVQVWGICEDGAGNIYAATQGGIFRSIDDGLTWVRRSAARTSGTYNCIVYNATLSALFLVDSPANEVYYSTDGAATWIANGVTVFGETAPRSIYVTSDDHMVAGGTYNMYYTSSAAVPVTWTAGLVDVDVTSIRAFYEPGDGYIYAAGTVSAYFRAVYPTTATQLTWNYLPLIPYGATLVMLTGYNGRYYLGPDVAGTGLYMSNDMLAWVEQPIPLATSPQAIMFSPTKGEAYMASFDDILAADITADDPGREASTCNAEVYVANRRQFINYTHVYVYDLAPGPTWTRILPYTAPFNLLPAVPAQDDALYIGICTDHFPTPGILRNVVFDIGTAARDLTIAWEYYGAAAWRTLRTVDNTSLNPGRFGRTGVNSVSFEYDGTNAWATTNNGGATPTAYWIRARVTNVPGAGVVCPTQRNRDLYAVTWPYVDLAATELKGDLPSRLKVQIENEGDKDDVALFTQVPMGYIGAGYISIQEHEGHENCPGYLNASSLQNQMGVTTTLGLATTYGTSFDDYPTYQRAVYNPTGAMAFTPRVTWDLNRGLTSNIQGDYHALLRCVEFGGDPGNIGVRLRISTGSGGADFVTDTQYLWHTNDWAVLSFGRLSIVNSNLLPSNEMPDQIQVMVECSAVDNSTDLGIYDLMLLPVDGWTGYFDNYPVDDKGIVAENQKVEVDSLTNPIYDIRATIKDNGGFTRSVMSIDSSGYMQAKPNLAHRLWVFLMCRAVLTGVDGGGGNAAFLTDAGANFVRSGVQVGGIVLNLTDQSRAIITGVQATRIDGTLYGGVDNDWDAADVYCIFTKAMTARPWLVGRLQMWHNDQYLSLRGAR